MAGDYEKAIAAFNEAVRPSPDISGYHHDLVMGHGRLVEHSGEIEAYNPAGKTRPELEFAIKIDANNVEALIDR
ncbi:MAG: hypothetical protein HY356_04890 [Gammaproteobacteria bacterium]|nr:hypothetical protein [Gammaproteobacteria bacterium]